MSEQDEIEQAWIEEVEQAWIEETERRVREVDSGEVGLLPGEQVMAELRALLHQNNSIQGNAPND